MYWDHFKAFQQSNNGIPAVVLLSVHFGNKKKKHQNFVWWNYFNDTLKLLSLSLFYFDRVLFEIFIKIRYFKLLYTILRLQGGIFYSALCSGPTADLKAALSSSHAQFLTNIIRPCLFNTFVHEINLQFTLLYQTANLVYSNLQSWYVHQSKLINGLQCSNPILFWKWFSVGCTGLKISCLGLVHQSHTRFLLTSTGC